MYVFRKIHCKANVPKDMNNVTWTWAWAWQTLSLGTLFRAAPLNTHAGNRAARGKLALLLEALSVVKMDVKNIEREAVPDTPIEGDANEKLEPKKGVVSVV